MLKFLFFCLVFIHLCLRFPSCCSSFLVLSMSIVMVAWTGSCSARFSFSTVLLGIFFSVICLTVSSHTIFLWMCLVLGSISTTGWLSYSLPSHPLSIYFASSVTGGLLFVFSTYSSSLPPLFLFTSLLLLIGFFPFQFWSFLVLPHLPLYLVCVFLGPIKFGYLWLLLESPTYFFWLGMLSLCTGLLIIYTALSSWALLWASSSVLLFQLLLLDSRLGLIYYVVYSITLLSISYFVLFSYSLTLPFICVAGIPPLGIFWAKLLSLVRLPLLHCLVLLFISSLVLFPYFYARVSCRPLGFPSITISFSLFFLFPYLICSLALA